MDAKYESAALEARQAMAELLELADPPAGSLVVVGCSSSEINTRSSVQGQRARGGGGRV